MDRDANVGSPETQAPPSPVDLPEAAQQHLRDHPELFLNRQERPNADYGRRVEGAVWELLHQPLAATVAAEVPSGPWIGGRGAIGAPEVVVYGVCLPGTDAECTRWVRSGPTLEFVLGVDLAASVARAYGARLEIWVPDNEMEASARVQERKGEPGPTPGLPLAVGEHVEAFFEARYQQDQLAITIRRTSRAEHAGRAYAVGMHADMAGRYARKRSNWRRREGVRRPWGRPSLFWTQVDFLMNIGAWTSAAILDGNRALIVADHDQIRTVHAAITLDPARLGALFYWPLPSLAWNAATLGWDDQPKSTRPARVEAMLNTWDARPRVGGGPRRMHRGALAAKLFVDSTEIAPAPAATLREIRAYALHSHASNTVIEQIDQLLRR